MPVGFSGLLTISQDDEEDTGWQSGGTTFGTRS